MAGARDPCKGWVLAPATVIWVLRQSRADGTGACAAWQSIRISKGKTQKAQAVLRLRGDLRILIKNTREEPGEGWPGPAESTQSSRPWWYCGTLLGLPALTALSHSVKAQTSGFTTDARLDGFQVSVSSDLL